MSCRRNDRTGIYQCAADRKIIISSRAPRKIGPARRTPQNCPRMIPFRSRSDSLTFTPRLSAIGSESDFSRFPDKVFASNFFPVSAERPEVVGTPLAGLAGVADRRAPACTEQPIPEPHLGPQSESRIVLWGPR